MIKWQLCLTTIFHVPWMAKTFVQLLWNLEKFPLIPPSLNRWPWRMAPPYVVKSHFFLLISKQRGFVRKNQNKHIRERIFRTKNPTKSTEIQRPIHWTLFSISTNIPGHSFPMVLNYSKFVIVHQCLLKEASIILQSSTRALQFWRL